MLKKSLLSFFLSVIALLSLLGTRAYAGPATPAKEMPTKRASMPADLKLAFENARYGIEKDRAQNDANGFSVQFSGAETRIELPGGALAGLAVSGYGWGTALHLAGPVTQVHASGKRLDRRYRAGLAEWFLNTPQGLEQGFVLAERGKQAKGPVHIQLAASGGWSLRSANDRVLLTHDSITLEYAGLKAYDASGALLASRMRVSGSHIEIEVDDARAVYPLTIDPTLTQQAELTPSGTPNAGSFGNSVALSSDGNTALVAAPYNSIIPNDFDAQGAVYVFTRSGTTWTEQTKITDPIGARGDLFGYSVALSSDGNTAVVGSEGNNDQKGAVYFFTRSGTTWTQQQVISDPNATAYDNFGQSVALSGDGSTALVGDQNSSQGAVYVFTHSDMGWTQQMEITDPNATNGDNFGNSVALSSDGNTALVAAYQSNSYQGAVYVYTRSGINWGLQTEITDPGAFSQDAFGFSVALSNDGNTALVGADTSPAGAGEPGTAYVYTRSGITWSPPLALTASDAASYNFFGYSVALSGDGSTALVGAIARDNYQGAAYLFTRSGMGWTQQVEITDPNATSGDYFGNSVALSGDGSTALVGSPQGDGNQGAAYVFIFVAPMVTTVPAIVGDTESVASATLTGARLTTGTVTMAPSATVPSGEVSSQNPTGGTTNIAIGSPVSFVLSTGPAVPSILGDTQTAASAAIMNAGLTVGTVTTAASPSVAAGLVISQSLAAGTSEVAETPVSFVVSGGPVSSLVVSAPSMATPGVSFNVTVTALDSLDDVGTYYSGTVQFSSSDGAALLPGNYTFNGLEAGVHTFSTTLNTNGPQTITATDTSAATITGTSGPISVGPSVVFVKTDTTTHGHWMSNYGSQGYVEAYGPQNPPSYDPTFNVQQASTYLWAANTSDPRALQNSGGGLAATWFSGTSFYFDLNLTGGTHQVAIYVLDWDDYLGGRDETIQVIDPSDNAVLDTRTISGFYNGEYLVWNIAGHVQIKVTNNASNAVVSAVFFDMAPQVAPMFTSPASTTFAVGSPGTFTVTASGNPKPSITASGSLPMGVTFNQGTGVLSGTPAPGTNTTYPLTLMASNGVGTTASQSFTLTVNAAVAKPQATFVEFDTSTQGKLGGQVWSRWILGGQRAAERPELRSHALHGRPVELRVVAQHERPAGAAEWAGTYRGNLVQHYQLHVRCQSDGREHAPDCALRAGLGRLPGRTFGDRRDSGRQHPGDSGHADDHRLYQRHLPGVERFGARADQGDQQREQCGDQRNLLRDASAVCSSNHERCGGHLHGGNAGDVYGNRLGQSRAGAEHQRRLADGGEL